MMTVKKQEMKSAANNVKQAGVLASRKNSSGKGVQKTVEVASC